MNTELEEAIKIAKEQGEPLQCECGAELMEETYRQNEGLCSQCLFLIDK